jgi:hypothetical protein
MKLHRLPALSVAALLSAAAGICQTNNQFRAHAECVRVVGIAIPSDDQAAARALVPAGAKITDVHSTPGDWTSFWGARCNILSVSSTTVSGTK